MATNKPVGNTLARVPSRSVRSSRPRWGKRPSRSGTRKAVDSNAAYGTSLQTGFLSSAPVPLNACNASVGRLGVLVGSLGPAGNVGAGVGFTLRQHLQPGIGKF